jgi:hypothetical protein
MIPHQILYLFRQHCIRQGFVQYSLVVIFIYQKSPGFKQIEFMIIKNLGLVIRKKDRNFSIGSNNGFKC